MFMEYLFGFRAPSVICRLCWMLFVPQFLCAVTTCPPPDFPEGGGYKPEVAEYEVGQKITYSCKDRLTMFGNDRMTCLSSGRWSGKTPFCDSPAKIKNPVASSRFESRESFVIDGSTNTCFRTKNSTYEYITVFLDRPAVIYAVILYLDKGKFTFKINISPYKHTSKGAVCSSYNAEKAVGEWVFFNCEENNVKAGSITIQVSSGTAGSISMCEIEVYAKDDEWCKEPPENFIANGRLEVSRGRAILSCNEGFKLKDNRPGYGTCENNKWSYQRLQCTEILCDQAIGNISHTEGEWHIDDRTSKLSVGTKRTLKCKSEYDIQGKPQTVICHKNGTWTRTSATCKKQTPPKDYKIIGIVVGSVVVIVILFLLGLTIFLIQRKKAREVVVIYKPGENNSYSVPPSVGGHSTTGLSDAEYSTVYYEAIQNNQHDPRNPPPKLPSTLPKLDRGYSKPVDDRLYHNTASPNCLPTDLAFGTLTKSSSLYSSMN